MKTLKEKERFLFTFESKKEECYYDSKDVKQHILQDNKDLDLLFMTIMTIISNNKNKTKIQGEIIAYIKKRFENFGDFEK